jgi:hypothetical protein
MTTPPLPASPCLRVRLDYTTDDLYKLGSRFFLSYTGSAPSAANCNTLASDVAAAWLAHLSEDCASNTALTEVDVLDIATDSGASGNWTGDSFGTASGATVPQNVAVNVEFDIARRYRGGKPRMFLPPATVAQLLDVSHWTSSFITQVNTDMAAFFTAIAALDIGSLGALAHVNLSYYKGFTNIANSSGRERAVPTYRNSALLDSVEGYACKAEVGSQKRRRLATTS